MNFGGKPSVCHNNVQCELLSLLSRYQPAEKIIPNSNSSAMISFSFCFFLSRASLFLFLIFNVTKFSHNLRISGWLLLKQPVLYCRLSQPWTWHFEMDSSLLWGLSGALEGLKKHAILYPVDASSSPCCDNLELPKVGKKIASRWEQLLYYWMIWKKKPTHVAYNQGSLPSVPPCV